MSEFLLQSATSSRIPEWLLKLLSIDPERLSGGTEHFRLARLPEGFPAFLAVLGIVAAIVMVYAIYRREGHVPTWRKYTLAALRSLLILGLAFVLAYPVLEVDRSREVRATTLVLIDDSLSQSVKDRYLEEPKRLAELAEALDVKPEEVRAKTRAELVAVALTHEDSAFLAQLEKTNRVVAHTFSTLPLNPLEVERAATGGDAAGGENVNDPAGTEDENNAGASVNEASNPFAPPLRVQIEPSGSTTDISGALRLAVDEQGGSKIAAVVLVTDGRATAGEGVASVGNYLRDKGIPVHAIGVGDPTPVRNVRLSALLTNERVFIGDPMVIDVRVEQQGYDDDSVDVELLDAYQGTADVPAEPVVLQTETVQLREPLEGGTREGSHAFRVTLKGTGTHRLTARVTQRAGEVFDEDNERTVTVEVVEEASKVLLIAGAPTYEYRFLKNLLRRDSRVHVAGWLMSADANYPQEGNVSLKRLPREAKDLFAYDVICLLDFDPESLPEGYPELLETFVAKQRGGLLYVAGEKFSGPLFSSEALELIRGMLPVTIDLSLLREQAGAVHEQSWPLLPTAAALQHPSTRLSSQPDRNQQLWAEIAEFYWALPTRTAKPGASVLFEHPDPSRRRDGAAPPVVAAQMYGGGRVLFSGIDSTWRWRSTAEEVYDQFWIQSIRYLTESRLMGDRRRHIQTDREAYELGSPVRISVRLEDENFQPVTDETHPAIVQSPDDTEVTVTLRQDPVAPGWFRGVHIPRSLGDHTVRLPEGESKPFTVDPPALEFQDSKLDEAVLNGLANTTGGSYSTLAAFASVPERIVDERQTIVTSDDPIPLWDNPLCLGLLVALLTLEWILRKLNRLL